MEMGYLERALELIESEPENWDMGYFVAVNQFNRIVDGKGKALELFETRHECGTTFCLAGYLTSLWIKDGNQPIEKEGDYGERLIKYEQTAALALRADGLEEYQISEMEEVFFMVNIKDVETLKDKIDEALSI